jgi:hypothetical protein
MNRKGEVAADALMLWWRIFLIAALVFFVWVIVGSKFSFKQDIRPAEAALLSNQIADCIISDGVIKYDFDIDRCFLKDGYYVNASLTSFDSDFKKEEVTGNSLEFSCGLIEKGTVTKQPPSCARQRYYALIDNKGKIEKGVLNLLVGIEKYDENV